MKGRQVVLGYFQGQEAAALMQDGQLIDLFIDPGSQTGLVPGSICRGTIERLMKGQGGAFVRLPDGQRGYLRDRSGLGEGKAILVQITGIAEDSKAIPLSTRLIFRGRYGLVTPTAPGINISRRIRDSEIRSDLLAQARSILGERSHGLILRSASAQADSDEIAADIVPLIDLADRLTAETEGEPEALVAASSPWEQAWTEWADPAPDAVEEGKNSFEHCGVIEAIDALLSTRVPLPVGAHVMIEPTRALTAIDVNTGSDTSPAASLKANIALARDLPRQLRLRGLGGQIVVDFAPVPKRDRAVLDQVLRAAFKVEGTETTLIGWTKMGLYEISRKRDRVALTRMLREG